MKNVLAFLAIAFAPVFAPALAADGTSDASAEPTMAELKAEIVKLEGKIDTLTKTVVTVVGRVETKVDGLTTKVDDSSGRGEMAVFLGVREDRVFRTAGGNIAGAAVATIPGGTGIRLPAGTYEITAHADARNVGRLEMHDGRKFLPLSDVYGGQSGSNRVRGIVSGAAVYSFHRQVKSAGGRDLQVSRIGARPATVAQWIREVTIRRL